MSESQIILLDDISVLVSLLFYYNQNDFEYGMKNRIPA